MPLTPEDSGNDSVQRDLRPARSSSVKAFGCSQALMSGRPIDRQLGLTQPTSCHLVIQASKSLVRPCSNVLLELSADQG